MTAGGTSTTTVTVPTLPAIPADIQNDAQGHGALESVWLVVALSVAAAGVAVVAIVRAVLARRDGRRIRRGPVAGVASLVTVLSLLAAAAGVNSYVGYVRDFPALWWRIAGRSAASVTAAHALLPVGRLVDVAPVSPVGAGGEVQPSSPASGSAATSAPAGPASPPLTAPQVVMVPLNESAYGLPSAPAWVYLPTGYTTARRWPMVLLLGGAPGSSDDWLQPGRVDVIASRLQQAGVIQPFVLVIPTTNPSFGVDNECLNTVNGPQVETYLTQSLLPIMRATFAVSTDRATTAIAGFSAGADCALNLGLRHQDLFSTIGAIDAEGWPGRVEYRLLGHNRALERANSPRDYIPTMTFTAPMNVYLSATSAGDAVHADVLTRELQARGQPVYRHDDPGAGHTWRGARNDVPTLMTYLSAELAPK